MSLFKRKCSYCEKNINKGQEIFRDVKIPGFIGTKEKAFCCGDYADNYEKEIEEHLKKSKGGSCCG